MKHHKTSRFYCFFPAVLGLVALLATPFTSGCMATPAPSEPVDQQKLGIPQWVIDLVGGGVPEPECTADADCEDGRRCVTYYVPDAPTALCVDEGPLTQHARCNNSANECESGLVCVPRVFSRRGSERCERHPEAPTTAWCGQPRIEHVCEPPRESELCDLAEGDADCPERTICKRVLDDSGSPESAEGFSYGDPQGVGRCVWDCHTVGSTTDCR